MCECQQEKHTQRAPSMKTERDYLNGWIKNWSHTQKFHPKWWTPEIWGRQKKKKCVSVQHYHNCLVTYSVLTLTTVRGDDCLENQKSFSLLALTLFLVEMLDEMQTSLFLQREMYIQWKPENAKWINTSILSVLSGLLIDTYRAHHCMYAGLVLQ